MKQILYFTASWCGPCRMENPAVVRAYNNFKDKKLKGFLITRYVIEDICSCSGAVARNNEGKRSVAR